MNIEENILLLKPLKICILNSDYSKSTSPLKEIYENFPLDPRVHLKNSNIQWDSVLIDKLNVYPQINKLRQKRYDIYFNLCCGVLDDDIVGYEVIRALEYYNLAYTGPDEKFCLLKKSAMKSLALSSDINTPTFYFAYNDEDIELADKHIGKYPMFVKHFNGNDSIGLTPQSKVNNFEEMKLMASKFIFDYGGALIEEYIDGREFTVLIIENDKSKYEPFVLDPIECEFHNGETFKHFDVKNRDVNGSVRKIKVDNVQMKRNLEEMAQKAFIYMYGKSYARVDIRADKNGKLYFLEINAPPTTFWHLPDENNADFIIKYNKLLKPEEVVYQIIHLGLVEYKKRQLPYYVSFTNDIYNGLGLFAKREIKKGELVMEYENKERTIVSKSFVERNFKELEKDWFKNYAYPLGDEIFVTWSENPDKHTPLNHSCEPNLWHDHENENHYARRDIKKGEHLTIDYATYVANTSLQFECKCGQVCCRKLVTSHDYMKPEIWDKYKGHFSCYLTNKINSLFLAKTKTLSHHEK